MSTIEYAITTVNKTIDAEKKVNQFLVKGHVQEKRIANFKRYQIAKVSAYKLNKKGDKYYDPKDLAKMLKNEDGIRAARRAGTNEGGLASPSEKNMNGDALAFQENGMDLGSPVKQANLNLKAPVAAQPAAGPVNASQRGDVYEIQREDSMNSSASQRKEDRDVKPKLNLKMIIQSLFKNIKNPFINDETNVPKEILLRTILIKKLILYLVFLLIGMSTFYLIYISVFLQFRQYRFKLNSALTITQYHNITLGVINEYLFTDTINIRQAIATENYSAEQKAIDEKKTNSRIESFRTRLLDTDIDDNVRSDFFFTDIGANKTQFLLRYSFAESAQPFEATKYTIYIMLLEKIVTIADSSDDREEAIVFIQDNFLNIVNRYFLDSFDSTLGECSRLLDTLKVGLTDIKEILDRVHGALRLHVHRVRVADVRHQSGDQAVHLRSVERVQLHRQRQPRQDHPVFPQADRHDEAASEVPSADAGYNA